MAASKLLLVVAFTAVTSAFIFPKTERDPNAPPSFSGKLYVHDFKNEDQVTVDLEGEKGYGVSACFADVNTIPHPQHPTVKSLRLIKNVTVSCHLHKGVESIPPCSITAIRMQLGATQEPQAFHVDFDEDDIGKEITFHLEHLGLTLENINPGLQFHFTILKKFRTVFTASMFDFGRMGTGMHDITPHPEFLGVRFHVDIQDNNNVSIYVSRQPPIPTFRMRLEFDDTKIFESYARNPIAGGVGFANVFNRADFPQDGTLSMRAEFSEMRRHRDSIVSLDENAVKAALAEVADRAAVEGVEFKQIPGVKVALFRSASNSIGLKLSYKHAIKSVFIQIRDREINTTIRMLQDNQLLYKDKDSFITYEHLFRETAEEFLEKRPHGIDVKIWLLDGDERIAKDPNLLFKEWVRENGGDITPVDLKHTDSKVCTAVANQKLPEGNDGAMWFAVASAVLSRDAKIVGWNGEVFKNEQFLALVKERGLTQFDEAAIAFALLIMLRPGEIIGTLNLREVYEMLAVQSEAKLPYMYGDDEWEPFAFSEIVAVEKRRKESLEKVFDIVADVVPGISHSEKESFLKYVAMAYHQLKSSNNNVEVMIIPGLSCIKHSHANANVQIVEGDQHFTVIPKRPIEVGEQLFADFSEYRMLSKHNFFAFHGFWPDVPYDAVAMRNQYVSPQIESTVTWMLDNYGFQTDHQGAMRQFVQDLKVKRDALANVPEPSNTSPAWMIWESETYSLNELITRFDTAAPPTNEEL